MCIHDASFSELECSLSCSHWPRDDTAPEEVGPRFRSLLDDVYEQLRANPQVSFSSHRYGDGEREQIDVYGEELTLGRLFIWIHGGYWQRGSRVDVSPLVTPLLSAGITVASIGYELASPSRPVTTIIDSIVQAIEYLLTQVLPSHRERIVVGGFSAGAQLAFKAVARLRSPLIAGVALFAGATDLRVLPETCYGKAIGLSVSDAAAASCEGAELAGLPRHIDALVAVGDKDAPGILKMVERMAEEMKRDASKLVRTRMEVLPGDDHFSLIARMIEEGGRHQKLLLAIASGDGF